MKFATEFEMTVNRKRALEVVEKVIVEPAINRPPKKQTRLAITSGRYAIVRPSLTWRNAT